MKRKYKVITLCGSTRFKDEFLEAQRDLTLEGNIVLSLGVFGHADNVAIASKTKEMLDGMHLQRIDMADEIFVINVDGYIGKNTQEEIEYAKKTGKPVKYLVPMRDDVHDMREEPDKEDELLTEKEFMDKYCDYCGSQRCFGVYDDMFEGCLYKSKLKRK